ncbi:MAG: DUF362 domain-containing protein [Clostridia bacterium]|nr:DUF362 domain-containing protein [Clostridia bacterium]
MTDNRQYTCAIVPCADYGQADAALARALNAIGGLGFITPGTRVVIKANLVAAMKPEACATTHPALVTALTKMLVERGASVTVGDSPGGFFTPAALAANYAATGMTLAEKAGAKLNRNVAYHRAQIDGAVMRELVYTDYLDDCDMIIDFAKLKSHGMVGMSAAVKNMYGVIPGLIKPETHYLYPDVRDFADMLVDINEYFKPRLSIIDAVDGMEGNGPTAGTPRHIGAVIAALTPYEADAVAARLIGLDPAGVPTLEAAKRRGLCSGDIDGIALYGDVDSIALSDFKTVPRKSISFYKGTLVGRFVESALVQKPMPIKKKCVACGKCVNICPAKAISFVTRGGGKYPRIDRRKCIRCFCCQEFCPKAAMVVHRTLIARVLQRIK